MGARREARECALQMMYQWDLRRDDPRTMAATYWEVHAHDADVCEFAERLVLATVEHLESIDSLIERHARRWRLERMETVDRNVLRVAVQELLHEQETPPAVVIDEAIEIARRYSTPDSPQFINGLLDSIRKEIESRKTS
jgi:N utilization substance protein B